MIKVIQTTNYSLTFNNDVLVSAKDLLTGRFVKHSIALAEYRAQEQAMCQAELTMTNQVAKQSKNALVAASKVLFSASIMTALTILFVVLFTGLFLTFFAASPGNVYVKGFSLTVIVCVACGGIGLCLLDQFNTVKKQLKGIIS